VKSYSYRTPVNPIVSPMGFVHMANLKLVSPDRERRSFDGWSDEEPESVLPEIQGLPKPVLYGLPCARCKAYYDAKLKACPICRCTERVSPTQFSVIVHPKPRAA